MSLFLSFRLDPAIHTFTECLVPDQYRFRVLLLTVHLTIPLCHYLANRSSRCHITLFPSPSLSRPTTHPSLPPVPHISNKTKSNRIHTQHTQHNTATNLTPILTIPHPHLQNFPRQAFSLTFRIMLSYCGENEDAFADGADELVVDGYGGGGYALE